MWAGEHETRKLFTRFEMLMLIIIIENHQLKC
jgi:hypothetical protein